MNKEFFSRNLGFITENEQEKISKMSIGIAGAGGDGGLLAERLVRFGIGKIILADPEQFEPQNINRQFGANQNTLGKNKAEAVGEELKLINPELEIIILDKGITKENINFFVSQSDVIIDEIEYSMPEISVMLAKEARSQKKFVYMGANIGWGASVFCFDPEGMTFEEYFEYNEKENTINAFKYMPKLPGYLSKDLLESVLRGETSMPSVSSSVGLVAALVSSNVILYLARKKQQIIVPEILFFDTSTYEITKGD